MLAQYFIIIKKGKKMAIASINVRIDRDVKNAAEIIFKELGINMTSAINM